MENYIQNIALINQYLNKTLSKTDIQNFEYLLKTDSNFNTLYDEHKTFLEGLKRQQLKTEIVNAKRSYLKSKLFKFIGVSIVVLTVVVVAYVLISNQSQQPIHNNNQENNSIIIDSVSNKASLKRNDSIVLKDSIFSKKEIVVEGQKTLKNIEISFTKPPQKLKINTQKDTVIVCNEGTKLDIKANSFIDGNGSLIKGIIDLNVTEYYKLSDMLLANLSTTSDGKPLETGGMLNIKAFKGDELLQLKKSIEISFPTSNKKEGMQLFSGEWKNENVNWKLAKNEILVDSIKAIGVEENIEVPFAIVEEVPIFPGCEEGNNMQKKNCFSAAIQKHVQRNFDVNVAASLGFEGRQRVNTIFKIDENGNVFAVQSRASHPTIEAEANRVMALLPKMKPGLQRGKAVTVPYSLPIIFTVSDNAKIFKVSVPQNSKIEMDTVYDYIRGDTEFIRRVMHDNNFAVDSAFIKKWKTWKEKRLIRIIGDKDVKVVIRKPLFDMENTRFKILEDDSISRGGHIIRKVWDESQVSTTSKIMRLVPKPKIIVGDELVTEETLQKRLDNPNENIAITTKDVNNYAMRILDLGWINLDRFVRYGNVVDYKIKVKNRNGSAKVSMVFKSLSSILPSKNIKGYFSFGKVVNEEEVTLVAIKKQNQKLYLDVIDTNTKASQNIEFNFKEVSLQELKNELQKLNKLF
ncbi:energy transducer TonB [Sabulilitoribacter arenilitoris]|uniref:Energy transducer TonB n=1 Tax=Wocania arenilitoris TaxID=2044858 RepID=A0AAE3EJX1_9FLAO|nr:energy transducer TonB [Wocania arenilitoris]MCF7566911.1 energy transducer TonB [Wocania arenilitoris]